MIVSLSLKKNSFLSPLFVAFGCPIIGKLMMLPVDLMLIAEPAFKKWVEVYAKDEDLFFTDFAKAFAKLLELGVPFPSASKEAWWKFW